MIEENQNIIIINSAFNKTPGLKYKIAPCPDRNGKMPDCVRRVDSNNNMILSEKDKSDWTSGKKVFIPENVPIIVEHGTVFDLNNPLQAAQWEAIKNSKMIAKERSEKDANGNFVVDGGAPTIDKYQNPKGRYGVANLYIERPGLDAKRRNDFRKLVVRAQNLIMDDSLSHLVLMCKLFEKDMSHANSNDVEEFLFNQALKNPEKVIKFYNSEESSVRLLVISARDKGIITTKQDGMYYADIKLGSNLDLVVDYLRNDTVMKNEIKKETFPELEAKTKK